ncbi:hypothetical protein KCU85_g1528, partial [Aureobasidium melanogenum]
MSNPYAITASESFNALLKDTLSCLAIAFMFCFINTLARTNVYAMYGCSLSLILASAFGFMYTYDILSANHSSWPIVFKLINLVAFTSIIAQEIWFMHKAYTQIFSQERLKCEELQLKTAKLLHQWEVNLEKQEEILSKWGHVRREQGDNLSKWEKALTKQEEELKKRNEPATKAERPDLKGLEVGRQLGERLEDMKKEAP